MNLQNIFSEIEKVDADIYERMDTRRSAMRQFAKFTGKAALATMPLALGSMFKKAYGQTPADVIATLQFALTLEYLEAKFYQIGVAGPGVIANSGAAGLAALQKIRDHEIKHVAFLKSVIIALGSTPTAEPTFDFTAGNGSNNGPFLGWEANYDVFLAMAQTFEDTGVRAYKGAAGTLINNKTVLTAALNIHSVEGRHASHIRQMRRARSTMPGAVTAAYVGNIKPWINNSESNIGGPFAGPVQPSYNGEEITVQGGINIVTIANVSATAASASFDEPLSRAAVLAIVDPFIV
ncbi:MAG: ferritin-like domain-containing protein [Ferruginibacter sp.]|nr:ferritin-like domain-containing protein [Ferruginibacter sp.]